MLEGPAGKGGRNGSQGIPGTPVSNFTYIKSSCLARVCKIYCNVRDCFTCRVYLGCQVKEGTLDIKEMPEKRYVSSSDAYLCFITHQKE